MGGNLRTTEFLKECLADALINLLKEKPIEKITIPEIAKLSGVGRTTYFRNFTSKNDMLTNATKAVFIHMDFLDYWMNGLSVVFMKVLKK